MDAPPLPLLELTRFVGAETDPLDAEDARELFELLGRGGGSPIDS